MFAAWIEAICSTNVSPGVALIAPQSDEQMHRLAKRRASLYRKRRFKRL
jgi:hypothetical protein